MKKKAIQFVLGLVTLAMVSNAQAAGLQWNAASGTVAGYNVYFGPSEVGFVNYKDVGNVTEIQDIVSEFHLAPGKDYSFTVKAYNAAGESGGSNIATYSVPAYTPPEDNIPAQVIVIPGPVTITIEGGNRD